MFGPFGKAAKYLFRPCLNDDGSPDEECRIFSGDEPVVLTPEEIDTIASIKRGSGNVEKIQMPVNAENAASANTTETVIGT